MLTGATPRLTTADAVEIGATLFGVRASAARDLGSERDRTFMLDDVAILKVSNAAESMDVLDMEAAAALHVHAVDPGLGVALPRQPIGPSEFRAQWGEHAVRLYDVLPGNSRIEATALSDAALARVGRDDRAARGRAARLHPSERGARDGVGRAARARRARDAELRRRGA